MMRIAYFDCPMGISGDMILGALIDAGLDGARLVDALANLNLPGYELHWERVMKGALVATQFSVEVQETGTERRLADVQALLTAAKLPEHLCQATWAIFQRLAEVEAEIHGTTADQIHFHELGAIDTLVDVVGVLWGLTLLDVDAVCASPLPAARGWVRSRHGPLPLPTPATLALLRNVPLVPALVEGELVTPTGAALLTHLAVNFGPPPAMMLRHIGYGDGRKDFARPNVLRVWLGDGEGTAKWEPMLVLETNIDDMNPQLYQHVADQLFDAGALDVTLGAVQMKKDRPGTLLSVLTRQEQADALVDIIFRETTTLGIRRVEVSRQALPRRFERAETLFGPVQLKVARLPDGTERAIPEYEDCRRLAYKAGVSLMVVVEEAKRIFAEQAASVTGPDDNVMAASG
jgi:uncharacterized protein (TIGR00299 family) protein